MVKTSTAIPLLVHSTSARVMATAIAAPAELPPLRKTSVWPVLLTVEK